MLNDLFKMHEQHQQHVTSGDTQAAAQVLASSAVLCERLLFFLDGAEHLRASRAEREKIVSKLKVPEQLGRACVLPPAVLSDTCSVQLLLAAYSSVWGFACWAADNRLWLEDAAVNAQPTQEQNRAAACANSLLQ